MQAHRPEEENTMKQFGTILKFELKGFFKNKIFVGVTIFLVALIAAVMFFPRISSLFNSDQSDSEEILPVMLLTGDFPENTQYIQQVFAASFPNYDIRFTEDGVQAIKDKITSGEAECAFVLNSLTSYTYYVNNLSLYDDNTHIADTALQNIYRISAMTESGIPASQAENILSLQIDHETESLGKDQIQNFFYTYIMIFALYMVILLYGQMVATNVATEKSSKAMELLITSADPSSMMFGKVIASCLAGLIQLICVFGSAFLFFHLNKNDWNNNMIIRSIFDMPVSLLLYMLLFFILGFFIYAFMFGAVGSMASKLEDINTSAMPATLLFVAGFLVVMMSMSSGNVDTLLMKICSYIPFTSPMAMFTRIAMSTVPVYEVLLSVLILIGSVIGVGIFSAKIYRVGVLLYGTTPKISSVIKAMWKA